jgi:Prion-inhibition and propagation
MCGLGQGGMPHVRHHAVRVRRLIISKQRDSTLLGQSSTEMDASALVFSVCSLFDQLTRVGLTIHATLKTVQHFAVDAESLRIQVADEIQRIRQLRSLLLTPSKIVKGTSLFEQLPQDGRQNLAALLYHVAGPLMGEFGDLWSRYLSNAPSTQGVRLQPITDERTLDELMAEFEQLQAEDGTRTQVKIRDKIRWALGDKDKATNLVSELADSTRRIKDDIELFCFPLGILNNNAAALRDDADAVGSGWAEDSKLIKLIVDNPAVSNTDFEINNQQLAINDGQGDQEPDTAILAYYESEPAIVQFRSYQADDDMDAPRAVTENVLRLSALLRQLNQFDGMKFRTLKFCGFYQEMRRQRFGFVFSVPKSLSSPEPTSLKQLLAGDCPFPLDQRFKHAHALAVTLSRFHRVNWVHKNLRSENVLYFRSRDEDVKFSGPWIIGLTHARRDDGDTSMMVDASFERNIYRHVCFPDFGLM